jgi:phosphate starvation-inducible membrane PsiE
MITRSNLAEQLRDYQIRSKHDWASVSFFSSTSPNITTSRYHQYLFTLSLFVYFQFICLCLAYMGVTRFHFSLTYLNPLILVLIFLMMEIVVFYDMIIM